MRVNARTALVFTVILIAVILLVTGCYPEEPPILEHMNFHMAIFQGDYPKVRRLLRRYPTLVTWAFDFGAYQGDVLTTAAHANEPEIVKLLLKAGAPPNYANDDGVTPLIAAVDLGYAEIARILIEAGASLSMQNTDSSNVMHFLAEKNPSQEMADLLFESTDDISIIDHPKEGGFTPLTLALAFYNHDLAFRFIRAGASLEKALKSAPHIIPEFVIGHHDEILEYLWEQSVIDPYEVFQSNNLFHYGVWFNNVDFIRDVVERGLWDDSTNHDGETPMDIAERMDHQEIIDIVTEAGLAVRPVVDISP